MVLVVTIGINGSLKSSKPVLESLTNTYSLESYLAVFYKFSQLKSTLDVKCVRFEKIKCLEESSTESEQLSFLW